MKIKQTVETGTNWNFASIIVLYGLFCLTLGAWAHEKDIHRGLKAGIDCGWTVSFKEYVRAK